jgi:hypothetical protein
MNVPDKAQNKYQEETRTIDYLNCVFFLISTICLVKFGFAVFLVLHIDINIGIALCRYH